tara:strand:+ start:308 stop:643 length:336 start_codon:yes stop_codon:yes gene_type:complete
MEGIKIGKNVSPEILEDALRNAAKEVRWRVRDVDRFTENNRTLGPVYKKNRKYKWTDLKLRGAFLPAMEISFNKRDETISWFNIHTGIGFGVALPYEVDKYLKAVRKNLYD